MSQPKRLVVAYEDGSTKEVAFNKVGGQMRLGLAQLGLVPASAGVGTAKHYLLLRWRDGWQEVLGVDAETADLLRYYVIQRIEDRGRLSLEVGGEYPELCIIERTPRDVVEAVLLGEEGVRSYELEIEVERWEGIFEAGGKKEFVKYDKTSAACPHAPREKGDALNGVLDSFRSELAKSGRTPQTVLAMEEPLRVAEYKELAAAAGLRGFERQEDVYGFVESLLKKM
jgi:hypothetical protein